MRAILIGIVIIAVAALGGVWYFASQAEAAARAGAAGEMRIEVDVDLPR